MAPDALFYCLRCGRGGAGGRRPPPKPPRRHNGGTPPENPPTGADIPRRPRRRDPRADPKSRGRRRASLLFGDCTHGASSIARDPRTPRKAHARGAAAKAGLARTPHPRGGGTAPAVLGARVGLLPVWGCLLCWCVLLVFRCLCRRRRCRLFAFSAPVRCVCRFRSCRLGRRLVLLCGSRRGGWRLGSSGVFGGLGCFGVGCRGSARRLGCGRAFRSRRRRRRRCGLRFARRFCGCSVGRVLPLAVGGVGRSVVGCRRLLVFGADSRFGCRLRSVPFFYVTTCAVMGDHTRRQICAGDKKFGEWGKYRAKWRSLRSRGYVVSICFAANPTVSQHTAAGHPPARVLRVKRLCK